MTAQPQIEPVTDEDHDAFRRAYNDTRDTGGTLYVAFIAAMEQDRRRVVERQANHGTTHAEGCVSWGRGHYECAMVEIERLRAEVAKMHARRAVLFGELIELKHAIENGHRASAIAIIDAIARVIPDQSKTLAELRAEVARYEELLKVRDDIEPLPQLLTDGARAHYLTPAQVKAFHPCDTKRFDEDNAARTMVSERHGKGDLVLLVTAILCQLADARAEVAAHRKHDVLRCDALMRAEAEVSRLTAACAAKDEALRLLTDMDELRETDELYIARAALSTDASKGRIDATGAVEALVGGGSISTVVATVPDEWAGSRVLIVRVGK